MSLMCNRVTNCHKVSAMLPCSPRQLRGSPLHGEPVEAAQGHKGKMEFSVSLKAFGFAYDLFCKAH